MKIWFLGVCTKINVWGTFHMQKHPLYICFGDGFLCRLFFYFAVIFVDKTFCQTRGRNYLTLDKLQRFIKQQIVPFITKYFPSKLFLWSILFSYSIFLSIKINNTIVKCSSRENFYIFHDCFTWTIFLLLFIILFPRENHEKNFLTINGRTKADCYQKEAS